MKYVLPIIVEDDCRCDMSMMRFTVDYWGVTGTYCTDHGELMRVSKMEFDSEEELIAWKEANEERVHPIF